MLHHARYCCSNASPQLRANILSPLTDPVTIDDRLDAVRPLGAQSLLLLLLLLLARSLPRAVSSAHPDLLAPPRPRPQVEELVTTEERSRAIRTALEPLKALDLDKVVSRLLSPLRAPTPSTTTTTSARPPSSGQPVFPRPTPSQDPSTRIASHLSHLLSLRAFLTALPRLRAALDGADARALRAVGRALGDGGLEAVRGVVEAGVNRDVWAREGEAARKGGGGKGGVGGGRGGGGAMVGRHARLFAIKAERKLLCVPLSLLLSFPSSSSNQA